MSETCIAKTPERHSKRVAVVYGGFSSEFQISVKSGKSVARWLRDAGWQVEEVVISREGWWAEGESAECGAAPSGLRGAAASGEAAAGEGRCGRRPIDRSDFSVDGRRFDTAFIVIHGDPGENGRLQAYFELIGQNYVGCSSQSALIAFDKFACKSFLKGRTAAPYALAPDVYLQRGEKAEPEAICRELGLPLFVKPCSGGSSYGVSKVKSASELPAAIDRAFEEGDSLIIESAVSGTEVDCAVYVAEDGEAKALPLIEIVPEGEYFDYEAKYLGKSREICPARLPEDLSRRVQEAAVDIFKRLACTGLVRMDFIVDADGKPWFLEVNPNPGMTPASLVPQMVREAGLKMEDFLSGLVERSL